MKKRRLKIGCQEFLLRSVNEELNVTAQCLKIFKRKFFTYNNSLNCTMRMFECNKNGNGLNVINEMNETIGMDMMEADEDVYQ